MTNRSILVTGGAGFIGSHTCVVLIESGFDVVVIDNLSNSNVESLNRIEMITGRRPRFYQADILDQVALDSVFEKETSIGCVIHFAGLKSVSESIEKPMAYYQNNVVGLLTLLDTMAMHGCRNLIFSSSATVYGVPSSVPITEDCPRGQVTNPYGRTKVMSEDILSDFAAADPAWNIMILRYFNPIGAHPSGLLGEEPKGVPSNLMPYITQVAMGKLPHLHVFGDDYDTVDGTGVRDYIHVMDLAYGHTNAIDYMEEHKGVNIFNIGTGCGYSVLQVIHAFEDATGITVPYEVLPRRSGDVAVCYASADKAESEMGWCPRHDLRSMCEDSWRWQSMNPEGYRTILDCCTDRCPSVIEESVS